MKSDLPNRCPACDLIILSGAIFEVAARTEELGPIIGLDRDVDPAKARAGYVGMSSLWLGDGPNARFLYACPRCKTNLLDES